TSRRPRDRSLGRSAFVEDHEPAAVGLTLPDRVEARRYRAGGILDEPRREGEVARGEHLDLIGLPRERRLRAVEERLPCREHGRAAAQRHAAGEEHTICGDVAPERGEVALGHGARERSLGSEDFLAPRFERALRGRRGAGEQQYRGQEGAMPPHGATQGTSQPLIAPQVSVLRATPRAAGPVAKNKTSPKT